MAKKLNYHVGIDLGSRVIRVVVSRHTQGSPHPGIVVATGELSQGIKHGTIVSKREALESIKKALQKTESELGEKITIAHVSISPDSMKSSIVKIKTTVAKSSNELSELDIEKTREEALKSLSIDSPVEVLNISTSSIHLDGKKVHGNPVGMVGQILEVNYIIITVPKKILENTAEVLERAGLETVEFIVAPFAASIPLTTRRDRSSGIGLLNIGADNSSFVIYENDLPISFINIPFGGNHLTDDIALGLGITPTEAEDVKKNIRGKHEKKINNIVNARLADICDILKKEILKVNKLGKLTSGIIVYGGSAKLEKIEDRLSTELSMPIIDGSDLLAKITAGVLKDPAWSTAYGLTYLTQTEKKYLKESGKAIKRFFSKIFNIIAP
jgi:cell division protein FtsA